MGRFAAANDAARAAGDVTIQRGGIVFDRGVTLYTRVLNPRRGSDVVARGGDTYAALARGPADTKVELRRITEQTLRDGARSLCGEARPAYAALAFDDRSRALTVLVFAGEEPPGPTSTQTTLCASYTFAAPGGRMRQGVLLR